MSISSNKGHSIRLGQLSRDGILHEFKVGRRRTDCEAMCKKDDTSKGTPINFPDK